MRIVCPSCSADYDVPDSLVTAGRVVRCAACGGEWIPVEVDAAEPDSAPPSALQPPPNDPPPVSGNAVPTAAPQEPPVDGLTIADAVLRPQSAMDRLALHSALPSSRLRLRLAWLASLAVLAFLGWAAYAWRAEISTTWPPSARMYAIFGVQSLPNQ
jgi:predicted Zn finger-like uncharacterized protein